MPRSINLAAGDVVTGDLFEGDVVTDVRWNRDETLVTIHTAKAVTALDPYMLVSVLAAH